MNTVGETEAKTKKHVTEFFLNTLGYSYLGFWKDRAANSNVEGDLLEDCLEQRLDKTRAIKQGVMQELLTGRTRLV